MFGSQHYMDAAVPDLPKKRGRDDEQVLGNTTANQHCSFSEHRNKRLHSLPVRTSPRAHAQGLPSVHITPLNASPGQFRHSYLEEPSLPSSSSSAHQHRNDTDMDMDGGGGGMQLHTQYYPAHLEPEVDPSRRMPTPIQPSFAAQVRGQHNEWAGNGLQHDPSADHHSIPRTMTTGDGDWQAVQNNRRLPSPISECDDAMSSSDSNSNSNSMNGIAHHHAMEHPNAVMDMEGRTPSYQQDPDGTGGDPAGPSPERRGHIRHKHTINTWTWQPGMKKSFSVGYRADCEKCRLKVPGHFNHIVIS
ncbi:Conserved hypothetical, protein [Geosmithia morbida]|uniref:Conserved hypothetical, protein n=1 Tax=Geosmithia morbida TaxID=1094350 RepID=A0A9P4YUI0_9HYPO|nr:Conserved hypothetical, protein [Geosmithia morbida]KAF4122787.1 Conserved hypothetical, protein [Geosmithia morbida]